MRIIHIKRRASEEDKEELLKQYIWG